MPNIYFIVLQTVHKTFLRTVPPYFHQADVWLKMLEYFDWNQVVFIHSMDIEGRMILNRFQSKADEVMVSACTFTCTFRDLDLSGMDNTTAQC